MNYLGKFIDNFRYAYKEINAATLTGAIDVIVVEQPDGSFTCSPFHVRFGKIGVLRSREKIVEIEINGEPCDIYMKLGESGEAFFVEELTDKDRCLPEHLVCSPIHYTENEKNESESVVWNSVLNKVDSQELISELNEESANKPSTGVKTFHARTVQSSSDCEIPGSSEFRPIQCQFVQGGKLVSKSTTSDGNSTVTTTTTAATTTVTTTTTPTTTISKTNSKKKRRRRKKNQVAETKLGNGEDERIDENVQSTSTCVEFLGNIEESESGTEQSNVMTSSVISDLHFFSDTDIPCGNYDDTKTFSSVQSDTEFEVSTRPKSCEEIDIGREESTSKISLSNGPSWRWGELPSPVLKSEDDLSCPKETSNERNPEAHRSMLASMLGLVKKTKRIKKNELEGSIYLSQIDTDEIDPEIAKIYLSQCQCMDKFKTEEESGQHICDNGEEDEESGNGPSLAQSPISDDGIPATNAVQTDEPAFICNKDDWDVAMSLCGGLNNSYPTDEQFNEHLISYEQFINDPAIFKNPNLIFRINGRMYQWDVACPLILSVALFKKPLPKEIINRLEEEGSVKTGKSSTVESNRHRRGYYSWFYWARTTHNKSASDSVVVGNAETAAEIELDGSSSSVLNAIDTYENGIPISPSNDDSTLSFSEQNTNTKRFRTYSSTDSDLDTSSQNLVKKDRPEKYRKTLRLTSEQIGRLNLKRGANELVFSVTTAYQGTTTCTCTLFLWKYDDKIVISDIDGTITKSDVLGHIMPIVGNVWAQNGVAKLFNRIEDNGYKLLYLSARAIGQSKGTRKYLNSIIQDDLSLPDGPLLLNPTSLLRAFHREVIEKKPEEFKISCLRDILALFPSGSNPFYAGYGNKINDVWTYQAVGIPMFRIFTINHRGVLRHELSNTFQSSYQSMSQIADQLFPVRSRQTMAEEFSEFNYWREPIPNIEDIIKLSIISNSLT